MTRPEDRALILTQYPIDQNMHKKILDALKLDVDFLIVSTHSPRGYLGLLSTLRKQTHQNVYVFSGGADTVALVPALSILSFFVRARARYLIASDVTISRLSLGDLAISTSSVAFHILWSLLCLACWGGYALLLKIKMRVAIDPNILNSDKWAFIQSNLWLGLQAGGSVSHTRGVITEACKVIDEVVILSPDSKKSYLKNDCSYYQIKRKHPYIAPRELNNFSFNLSLYYRAKKILRTFKGVLYQRTNVGSLAAIALSRKLRLPLIVEYNGSEIWTSRNWGTPFIFEGVIELIENVVLSHAHMIVCVSETLRDALIVDGIDPNRIVVAPNGVDPEAFDPSKVSLKDKHEIRTWLNIEPDAIIITFVGTFGPWHGAEKMATAAVRLSYLNRKSDNKIHFLFIGDGPRRVEVIKLAQKLISNGELSLPGVVDHATILKYLVASDILVAPTVRNPDRSPFFGSPTKLFEYLASGKPVIASTIGQVKDIFSDCRNIEVLTANNDPSMPLDEFGIGIEPGSVDQLTQAIQYAVDHPDWRSIAGENARRIALERYTWAQHFAKIDGCLEKIVRRTRVLVNGLHSRSGGGVTYLTNILPRLARDDDLDIHVLIHKTQERIFAHILKGVTVHIVDFEMTFLRLLFFEQSRVPMLERQLDVDVVYSPANFAPLFCRNNVILLRNALSVGFLEWRPKKLLYWGSLFAATALSIFRAKALVAVSEFSKRSAGGGVISMLSKDVKIIPHGVDPVFRPGPFEEREEFELLAVSDLYVQKNLHSLLLAISILVDRFPMLSLSIAGSPIDVVYAERLQLLTEQLGLQGRVFFLGAVPVDELTRFYRKCTLFVFPSTIETFGNPLVEAMASGAPIASSRTAAMPEIAGDAACYFDPSDVKEMVNVIADMLTDPSLRRELSLRAVQQAQRFSWDKNAEELIRVFDGLKRA